MVGVHGEFRQPVEIKGTLSNGPDNGEAFKFDGGVALLSRSQSLRSVMNNFEVLRPLRIDIYVAESIPQAMQARSISEKNNILRWVKVTDDKIAGEDAFQSVKLMLVLRKP